MNGLLPPLGAEHFSASGPGPAGRVTSTPTPAFVYDYLLGGKTNYPADREFGDRLKKIWPGIVETVVANRAFLHRAVTYLAQQGVDQFIDIGPGIPNAPNVHEIAQGRNPAARVAYVDNDPIVLSHGRALLTATAATTAVVAGDLHDPRRILGDPGLRGVIDLDRPVAVLLAAVLHFVDDAADPYGITDYLHKAVAPGSYLVVSHAVSTPGVDRVAAMYTDEATQPGVARTPDQIGRFFKGWEMVPPGVVAVDHWHPTHGATPSDDVWVHGGIGHKP